MKLRDLPLRRKRLDGYLPKPLEMAALWDALRRLVGPPQRGAA